MTHLKQMLDHQGYAPYTMNMESLTTNSLIRLSLGSLQGIISCELVKKYVASRGGDTLGLLLILKNEKYLH